MSIKSLFMIAAFVTPLMVGQVASADVALTDDRSVDFVTKAAQSDMFEVKSSVLALSRSKNPDVIAYAKLMIKDHHKLSSGLVAAAKAQSIAVPTAMDMNFKARLDELGAKGGDFDKAYSVAQVKIHEDAVGRFTDFSENALDGKLKVYAKQTLLIVTAHKAQADALKAKLE